MTTTETETKAEAKEEPTSTIDTKETSKPKGSGRRRQRKKNVENEERLERVIQVRRVTKVVKGGKRMGFRATIVVGDKEGSIGIGVGKAAEVPSAIQKGIAKAKINIILVDDEYIIRLNQQFLNKKNTTDVLSFSLVDENDPQLEGEVYANVEQIDRQAGDYHVPFRDELFRIIIHGLLHLIGFDDRTGEEKKIMIEKEDQYLIILQK